MGARSPKAVGGTPVLIHVYVEDVDAVFDAAIAAGATSLRAPEDQFYGDRSGAVRGSVRTPLERRDPCRGRVARGDGEADGQGHGRRLTAGSR